MNAAGLALAVIGVWLITQVLFGHALERLALIDNPGSGTPNSDTPSAPTPNPIKPPN